jgi:HNH/ENDO VII superfamily nuclease
MKRARSLPHLPVVLWCVLSASCATSQVPGPDEARAHSVPETVKVSELPGGQLRLAFEPVAPDPALEHLRVEEARAVLAALYESLPPREKSRLQLILASAGTGHRGQPAEWELWLREEYVSRYGPPLLPLPQSLETSRLFMALKLSSRYMGEGVREAARELFNSRIFVASVALSVFVYFAAWLAPEPVFTKAFVASLTLRLALAVGVLELSRVAWACVQLYREAEAASTVEQLEAVAERFGKAMGGTGLRVLMMVASMGVARGLPQVPQGGLGALLRAPRYALPEGLTLEGGATTVQMAADGTVVITGVAAGTAAATAGSACTDGSESKDGHHWHHLATNKNEISMQNGGPWTPLFEDVFRKAGMGLDAVENLVYLQGHKGPHPEEYHREVYRKLSRAVQGCTTVSRCKLKLIEALGELADEVCTPGSRLHQLATKSQD